jgi:uncharacterized protein YndB with AHSA1/START domain
MRLICPRALAKLCLAGPWEGTAAELLAELTARTPEESRPRDWPRNGRVLSGRLRADQAELREAGIALSFRKIGGGRRLITIAQVEANQPAPPADAEMRSATVAHLYILASVARVWSALMSDSVTLRQTTGFWFQGRWELGEQIELRNARLDRAEYTGKIIALSCPQLLQISWQCNWAPGVGTLTFEIVEREQGGDWTELMVWMKHPSTHVVGIAKNYWPALLSAVKTTIETGEPATMRGVVVRPPIFDRPGGPPQ